MFDTSAIIFIPTISVVIMILWLCAIVIVFCIAVYKSVGKAMIKKLINKILHLFGYHLTRMPRPYHQRKRKEIPSLPPDIRGRPGPGDGG
jgi:hypothetical protein